MINKRIIRNVYKPFQKVWLCREQTYSGNRPLISRKHICQAQKQDINYVYHCCNEKNKQLLLENFIKL